MEEFFSFITWKMKVWWKLYSIWYMKNWLLKMKNIVSWNNLALWNHKAYFTQPFILTFLKSDSTVKKSFSQQKKRFSTFWNTVFPRIVVATTILFLSFGCDNYSRETTIQRRKLLLSFFLGGLHTLNCCRTMYICIYSVHTMWFFEICSFNVIGIFVAIGTLGLLWDFFLNYNLLTRPLQALGSEYLRETITYIFKEMWTFYV